MSGIEILGIAASVLQIAEQGAQLSVKLFVFSRKIKNVDKSIVSISRDIAATGAVLQQLGHELGRDEHLRLCSDEAVATAQDLVSDCKKIFWELTDTLDGGCSGNTVVLGWKQRLKYPFLEPQIELLRSNLERLKSSLAVMLNVLVFAGQLKNQETLETLKDQKELVKVLVEDKITSEKKYRLTLKALEHAATAPAPAPAPAPSPSEATATATKKPTPIATKPNPNPTDHYFYSLPTGLRYRRTDIQQHCNLIRNLLDEVGAAQYQIDDGFRDRLQRSILGVHWEEWAPLRELYGSEVLINAFSSHPKLVRFWVSKLEAETLARATGRRNMLDIQDLAPLEGWMEMSHTGTEALRGPDSVLRSFDDLMPVSPDKSGPVQFNSVPVTISSALNDQNPSLDSRKNYRSTDYVGWSGKRQAMYEYSPLKYSAPLSTQIENEHRSFVERRVDPSLIEEYRPAPTDAGPAYTEHHIFPTYPQSFHTMSPTGSSGESDEQSYQTYPSPQSSYCFFPPEPYDSSLTHRSERSEKCPILSCEYNQKGFARKYDKDRHTLTHYKGSMVCGFCPGSGSAAAKSFNRADVFKRHLSSVHGVEQIIPNSRKRSPYRPIRKLPNYCQDATGKCSTCSAIFNNAQDFYEHLNDCILRVVQQEELSEAINQQRLDEVQQTSPTNAATKPNFVDEDRKESGGRLFVVTEAAMSDSTPSGAYGAHVARAAAPGPEMLSSRKETDVSGSHLGMSEGSEARESDLTPTRAEELQHGGTIPEFGLGVSTDVLADAGVEQFSFSRSYSVPELVFEDEKEDKKQQDAGVVPGFLASNTTRLRSLASRALTREEEERKEPDTRTPATDVELRQETHPADALQRHIDASDKDEDEDGSGEGFRIGQEGYAAVDKLLMEWTRLSPDEYEALQEEIGLDL